MKVVFLDIDGVLNSFRTAVAHGGYPHGLTKEALAKFDQTALALIRGICAVAGARIVLSSSWRILHRFQDVAEALVLPIVDRTPALAGPRGKEIAQWLSEHPDVETYAIVDDDSDMLPEQQANFVHTNGEDGFVWKDAVKLSEILGVDVYDAGRSLRGDEKLKKLQWEGA